VYVYLSKILPLFVMPVGVVLVLIALALLLMRRGWLKTSSGLLVAAVAILWVSATPLVAEKLYRELESAYPPKPLADIPPGDCIVVLGGVVGPALWPRVEVDFTDAIDRVYKAAQLARAGRGDMVIVSAGNQPWSASQWTEADLIRDLLVEWGVSKEAVFLEGSSRNTWENALYSRNLIESIHCGSALLVTSAAHMPRAVAAFNSAGIEVVPVSTDVRVTAGGGFVAAKLLPDARALAMTSEAIREWIGQKVYQLQGWN
jgi:uncharacterized SAM-binding protein YcdF (DUF218 family)